MAKTRRPNHKRAIDVIFLDIDGVLLPFGNDSSDDKGKGNVASDSKESNDENDRFTNGCIFPNLNMQALTSLLQKINDISISAPLDSKSRKRSISGEIMPFTSSENTTPCITVKGDPVLVLSSTWRARPDFVEDILSSFRAYVDADTTTTSASQKKENKTALQKIWEPHLESFFDLTDPSYHATRHEEIFHWIRTHRPDAPQQCTKNNKKSVGRNLLKDSSSFSKHEFIVRSWVALDDEDIVNVEYSGTINARNHAVQTQSSEGLVMEHVEQAEKLIKEQIKDFYGIDRLTSF